MPGSAGRLLATVLVGLALLVACTGGSSSGAAPTEPGPSATITVGPDGPAPSADGDAASAGDRHDVVPGFEPNASVVRIVDGDTIVADIDGRDERVRLIGIDTPESVIPDTPPECFGPEASDHLASLIPPGADVLIERDVEARDRFDRLLGYVYRPDGLFVNLQMATDGFAYPLTIAPNDTHDDAIRDAIALARRDDRGLWAVC